MIHDFNKHKNNSQKQFQMPFKKSALDLSGKVRNQALLKGLAAVGIGSSILQSVGFNNILTLIASGAGIVAGAYIINSLVEQTKQNSTYLAIGGAVATLIFALFPFSPFFQQFSITFLAAGLAGLFAHYFQK